MTNHIIRNNGHRIRVAYDVIMVTAMIVDPNIMCMSIVDSKLDSVKTSHVDHTTISDYDYLNIVLLLSEINLYFVL